ncbi:ABC transporter permease [Marinimicrobium sp. ABcell2]|uniref:ABC transporter permease n=1 Tax=Marinimicrobium sp. ABcell2 TaxID=3069751 RepID=UPI0027B606EA|nr:ABC transporter permease [Marinimicrobium sp. ABcell2]MDQ2077746.1 ABC transporter permease [Marinimicrobium sp. ABcell2]
MWTYYTKLAWLSIKKTPVLSVLMVVAIATGIAASLTTLTLYSVMASNPLAHKNDSLFRLQLDSWTTEWEVGFPNAMPVNITYKDAKAIYFADRADQTLLMARAGLTLERPDSDLEPTSEPSRLTTNSFFEFFDVEFVYGAPWSDSADRNGEQVAVISEGMNNRYFDGADSVGEAILLEEEIYTVVGVVSDKWSMIPNVYDFQTGGFAGPPQIYAPFFNFERRSFPIWGMIQGWKHEDTSTHAQYLESEMIWVQAWVSLIGERQFQDFNQYIHDYINEQKQLGRFDRPLKFALSTPEKWLELGQIVSRDNQILVALALAFLLVCLVNSVVLLLAKFLRKAPEAGLRRALGASRGAIFVQHLTEAAAIGLAGGLLGLMLSSLGLAGIRSLYSSYDAIAVINNFTLLAALVLALASSLLSGLIPAWQVSRAEPSRYLKTQ